jgi:hypothetical protein
MEGAWIFGSMAGSLTFHEDIDPGVVAGVGDSVFQNNDDEEDDGEGPELSEGNASLGISRGVIGHDLNH